MYLFSLNTTKMPTVPTILFKKGLIDEIVCVLPGKKMNPSSPGPYGVQSIVRSSLHSADLYGKRRIPAHKPHVKMDHGGKGEDEVNLSPVELLVTSKKSNRHRV